ncbi:MAG: hypothetical protein IKQ79_07025 [Bacteroidales bacterium]|nr:hypothetical protein [Bacteroidales bacterium]
MKTNITTDNYEAYLLDYMEGNLSPDEAEQLKAFVAAQGLDWDELTEELPHLEAPVLAYENKEGLKKKAAVVPLYVKIASAAAAAGLLLTVGLWPEKSLPKVEPIANLKPIEVSRINTNESIALIPRRATENPTTTTWAKANKTTSTPKVSNKKQVASERDVMPMLAEMQAIEAPSSITSQLLLAQTTEPDYAPYIMPDNYALASYMDDDYEEPTLGGKGFLRITDGKYESLGSMIQEGLQLAKEEINLAAADLAVKTFYRVDDRIEEAKERWEKRHEQE